MGPWTGSWSRKRTLVDKLIKSTSYLDLSKWQGVSANIFVLTDVPWLRKWLALGEE